MKRGLEYFAPSPELDFFSPDFDAILALGTPELETPVQV